MPNDHRDRRYQEREARRAERARRRAARREARGLHPEEPRKERVLHTRITEQLADDIRRVADELRVPVSNLVRNALEEAFSVVETVSENVGELLEEVFDEAERARDRYQAHRLRRRAFGDDDAAEVEPKAEPSTASRSRADFPEVLGWQSILLNRLGPCADCARPLERGDEAFVGVGAPGTPPILCPACAKARRS